MHEPDRDWWEKPEPEHRTGELETAGYHWTAEDEADMKVTDAQEDWVEWDTPRKPVCHQTGRLFDGTSTKETA
jgi:hypothetical protein